MHAANMQYVDDQVDGLASEEYVDNAVSDLASEEYVDDAIAGISIKTLVFKQLTALSLSLAAGHTREIRPKQKTYRGANSCLTRPKTACI